MKSRIIVTALLALVTGTSAASDWQLVTFSSTEELLYVDAASLTRHGSVVRAWSRVVYANRREVSGIKFWSQLVRVYFDCAERRWTTINATAYADKEFDEVVYAGPSTDDALLQWDDITPATIGEAMLEFACSKAPK